MTVKIAGSVSKSWLARALGVAFDQRYYFDAQHRWAVDRRCNEYVAEQLGDLNVFYTESNLGRHQWYGPNQVLIGGIQPNLIVGLLVGAEFLPQAGADADISPRCLAGRSAAALPAPADVTAHPLVQQWREEILAIQHSAGRQVAIPPFCWDRSGRAAVHGAVTSGLKFYGDEFFLNLLSEPAESQRVVDWLTDVSIQLVDYFAACAQLPVQSIHVGECAACMLDVDSFCRFVVPATSRLGRHFQAVRFHSCGCSDHLLEACQQIENLAELDVGGETSLARIRALWGPAFPVGIAPLVEDMRAATPERILCWFDRVRQENQDGDLTIGFHLEADYRVENLHALVKRVQDHNAG